jgi:preprotein translocase subunit SecB
MEAKLEEFSATEEVRLMESDDADPLWQVILTVSQQPAPERNFPYEFLVTIIGYCHCLVEGITDKEKEELVRVNGSSMLYGVVREIIRENTARGPWQPILLPTISFFQPKEATEAPE